MAKDSAKINVILNLNACSQTTTTREPTCST